MRTRSWMFAVTVLVGALSVSGCAHEWNGRVKEEKRGLLESAGLTEAAAIAKARAAVPEGTIMKAEIENEDGALIYTFDVKVEGEKGVREVHLDAVTGELLVIENEGGTEAVEEGEGVEAGEEAEADEEGEAAEGAEAGEAGEAEMGEAVRWDGKAAEETPGLLAKAKITTEVAARNALARVPGGVVTACEIENEEDQFVYSFDIRVPDQDGVTEVWVDAMTGKVVKVEHEK